MTQVSEPVTQRGRDTRRRLVEAARAVFARDGYFGSSLTGIMKEAGIGAASFYRQFDDKAQLFEAVWLIVQGEMLDPGIHHVDGEDPAEVIEQSNRAYLESYQANAQLIRAFEQAALTEDRFRRLRLNRAHAFQARNVAGIRRLQQQGKADPTLDATVVADLLSGMVSSAAHQRFLLGMRADTDLEQDVAAVTKIWVTVLGLDRPRPPVGQDARDVFATAASRIRDALADAEASFTR
jgi:AcrR family transcriptional regulator